MVQEKVRFGFSECALAFLIDAPSDVAPEWEVPTRIPGGVSFSMTPENSETKVYADNIPWFSTSRTVSEKGDLEMMVVTDVIQAKMLGWEIDKNGGLVQIANGGTKNFALLYQIENDTLGRRCIYYNCSAGAPSIEHTTNNEGIEVKTVKFPITALPLKIDGKQIIKYSLMRTDENAAVYDAWYDSVYVPDFTAAPAPLSAPVNFGFDGETEPPGVSGETGETSETGENKPIEEMTVAELKAFADAHQVDITGLTLKADILEALILAGY